MKLSKDEKARRAAGRRWNRDNDAVQDGWGKEAPRWRQALRAKHAREKYEDAVWTEKRYHGLI